MIDDNSNVRRIQQYPAEMQEYPHWIHVKNDKSPIDFATGGFHYGWKSNKSTLLCFSDAVLHMYDRPEIAGIGFALRDDDPFIVIDLDNPEKVREKALKRGVPTDIAATYEATCRTFHDEILRTFAGAYIERSQSGNGHHIIMRGTLPENAERVTMCNEAAGVEIYRAQQYIWLTGFRDWNLPYNLDGNQQHIDGLVGFLWKKFGKNDIEEDNAVAVDRVEQGGRRLGLSDAEVIARAFKVTPMGYPLRTIMETQYGPKLDWSFDTRILIGELDKITGDPDQVRRVLLKTPRLRQAGESSSGEDRFARTCRRFSAELRKSRAQNDKVLAGRWDAPVEHVAYLKTLDLSKLFQASMAPAKAAIAQALEHATEHGLQTYDRICERIEQLNAAINGEKEIDEILKDAGKLRLTEMQQGFIINAIKDKKFTGLTVTTIKRMLGQAAADARNERKRESDNWLDKLPSVNMFGQPMGDEANVIFALANSPQLHGMFAYDEFLREIMVQYTPEGWCGEPVAEPRKISPRDALALCVWLQMYKIPAKPNQVQKCIEAVAVLNRCNTLTSWLRSIQWDGVNRIDTWLTKYMGVADTSFARKVGRWWLISAVARALKPGCQVDSMLIFEGTQGAGKSAMLRALASDDWFTEYSDDMANKDMYQIMAGIWIFEFAEFATFGKKDTNLAKAVISKRFDKFRAPYAAGPEEHPRQLVFCSSVNESEYLQDATGARRYWSIKVGSVIDVQGVARDRDQLWAEAVAMFDGGARWWPDPVHDAEFIETAKGEAEERFEVDAWEETISMYLTREGQIVNGRYMITDTLRQEVIKRVKIEPILTEVIGLRLGDIGRAERMRVSKILKRLGYVNKMARVAGDFSRYYVLD